MASIEFLAAAAYCAYSGAPPLSPNYAKLPTEEKARWRAVAQMLRTQIQAIH